MRLGLRLGIILVALAAAAPLAGAATFRGITWGMSQGQVAVIEGTDPVSEKDLASQHEVVYKSWVLGAWATVTYLFENNGLASASFRYIVDKDRRQFVALQQAIAAAIGAPSFEKTDLAGWRLPATEIALAHLPDGTTYAAFWEKTYFARMNGGTTGRASASP